MELRIKNPLLIKFFSSVLEFVCLPWSEVCSARVTSLLLLLLLLIKSLVKIHNIGDTC